ncbi:MULTISPECIES: hypothetical protein [unclassified Asaia]|uniref:hypothetical protein n=1 Tax=unclassified Asaia TaxID=2685023 RepID=UPI0014243727|nr:hypothetical protein [Asaia sp. As-1742]NIE81065.1 hypothetical protein [Asaia sp. As-1742]
MSTALETTDFLPLADALRVLADMGVKNSRSHLYSLAREGVIPTIRLGFACGVRRDDLPEIAATVNAIGDRRKRTRTSSTIAANA